MALVSTAALLAACNTPSPVTRQIASSRKKKAPPPPPPPPPELGTITMGHRERFNVPVGTWSVTFTGNQGDPVTVEADVVQTYVDVGVDADFQLVDANYALLPKIPSGWPNDPGYPPHVTARGASFGVRLPSTGQFHLLISPYEQIDPIDVDVSLTPCVPHTSCDPDNQCNGADGCGGLLDCSGCTPTQNCSPAGAHCVYSTDCCAGLSCYGGANGTDPGTGDGFCSAPIQTGPGGGQVQGGPCSSDADCGSGLTCASGTCISSGPPPPPTCTLPDQSPGDTGYPCCSGTPDYYGYCQ